MRKILLPLFILVAMVSQAWAAPCGNFCQWDTGCFSNDDEHSGCEGKSKGCTCAEIKQNCVKYGSVFTGVTGLSDGNNWGEGLICLDLGGAWTGEGKDPIKPPLGCCKWTTENGKCWTIWEGTDPADGEDGAAKVESCKTGANTYWNGVKCPADGACPNGSPTYDGGSKQAVGCCRWTGGDEPDKCWTVYNDEQDKIEECRDLGYGDWWNGACPNGTGGCPSGNPVTPGGGGNSSPSGGGNSSPSGQDCSGERYYTVPGCGGYSPIITLQTPFAGNALIAMQNAVNLQVKGTATLRIYDMKGKALSSQMIEQGNHVVSLQLPRGLYIIKATSGSWKQTVKVTVK